MIYISFLYQLTPLHMAAKRGCTSLVKYFIDKEADVNIKDHNGVSISGNTADKKLALLIHILVNLISVYPKNNAILW